MPNAYHEVQDISRTKTVFAFYSYY